MEAQKANGVEVTPEMLRAGTAVFRDSDYTIDIHGDYVITTEVMTRLYQAMHQVSGCRLQDWIKSLKEAGFTKGKVYASEK